MCFKGGPKARCRRTLSSMRGRTPRGMCGTGQEKGFWWRPHSQGSRAHVCGGFFFSELGPTVSLLAIVGIFRPRLLLSEGVISVGPMSCLSSSSPITFRLQCRVGTGARSHSKRAMNYSTFWDGTEKLALTRDASRSGRRQWKER